MGKILRFAQNDKHKMVIVGGERKKALPFFSLLPQKQTKPVILREAKNLKLKHERRLLYSNGDLFWICLFSATLQVTTPAKAEQLCRKDEI